MCFIYSRLKLQQLAISPSHHYAQIYDLRFHPYTPLADTSSGYIAARYINRNTFHEVLLISHGGVLERLTLSGHLSTHSPL